MKFVEVPREFHRILPSADSRKLPRGMSILMLDGTTMITDPGNDVGCTVWNIDRTFHPSVIRLLSTKFSPPIVYIAYDVLRFKIFNLYDIYLRHLDPGTWPYIHVLIDLLVQADWVDNVWEELAFL